MKIQYASKSTNMMDIGSLVRISSYITAKARALLRTVIQAVGDIHVYYMDTDSLITDVEIGEEWLDEHRLGALKLEARIEQGYFISPKNYILFHQGY